MRRHCWDADELFGWQAIGASGGGTQVWEPRSSIEHPAAPGETMLVLAKLTEDGEALAIRFSPAHPAGPVPDIVELAERRPDPEFDDVLEPPEDTLRRWLEARCAAKVVLAPRRGKW